MQANRGASYIYYSLLGMLLKVFEELEAKQSVAVRHDQVTHPLLNQ